MQIEASWDTCDSGLHGVIGTGEPASNSIRSYSCRPPERAELVDSTLNRLRSPPAIAPSGIESSVSTQALLSSHHTRPVGRVQKNSASSHVSGIKSGSLR